MIPLATRIEPPKRSLRNAKNRISGMPNSRSSSAGGFVSSINVEGKSTKVTASDTPMPIVIIQPKLTTGRMSHRISDEKPATVVRLAYRHGTNVRRTASRTSARLSLSGSKRKSSR